MKKNMKRIIILMLTIMICTACSEEQAEDVEKESVEVTEKINIEEATEIVLSDESITVEGKSISESYADAVYKANDIIYYEAGHDFTYGEGSEEEAHKAEEAKAHTVVHITEPGMYSVSGQLSKGQIAIDLGEEAEEDPEAVVTLVLNNVDINCDVAPAVIFYNVYECGSKEADGASNTVDTTKAGANIYIVDGASNTTGVLNIRADNEGLDSELHLTINGGNITISSGNDGINTNEDGISVTTINGGSVNIHVTGTTGEGDGIDSNGWLVINGGTVVAEACSTSGDAGIDSDMGIHINGGRVIASGNMLDHISESKQNYVVMNFTEGQKEGSTYTLKNEKDEVIASVTPMGGMMKPEDGEMPEGMEPPENGEVPEGMEPPENEEMPEGMKPPEKPTDDKKPQDGQGGFGNREEMSKGMERPEMPERMEVSKEFAILSNGNYYSNVSAVENK